MGIVNGDFYDSGKPSLEKLLAKGEYKSEKDDILKGFKLFQKKYVVKSTVLQMLLVILGILSQVMNIASSNGGEDLSLSYLLIVICVILGSYVIFKPRNTFKKLEGSLGELEGTVYGAEIYTNKIKIETLYDPYISEEAKEQEEMNEKENAPSEENKENEIPPATIIHLDNSAVEIVESSELYVVYIKKFNVFVIPKSAFKPYENMEIKNKLSNIMGVRYKGE